MRRRSRSTGTTSTPAQVGKLQEGGRRPGRSTCPTDGVFGSFYNQAISKFAPHPAAARLWEEFLYSDQGQNIWLKGLSRPVRLPAMQKAGTADAAALKALPAVPGTVEFPSQDQQQTAAQKVVADRWNAEMSG